MNDPVNGSDSPAVSPMIQKIQDAVPEFGQAWEMHAYQNPDNQQQVIFALIPPVGSDQKARFTSKIPMMTNKGPVELGFTIVDAHTLEDAVKGWQSSARLAIAETDKNMREQAKRIIVPDASERASVNKKIALQ